MKKILALLLALAMIACLFVGCAEKKAEPTEAPKAETEAPKAETEAPEAPEETEAPEAPATDAPEAPEETEAPEAHEETEAPEETEEPAPELTFDGKVALVTDVGTIDDESFNQACWQGVKEFCDANGVEYTYYQPTADSTDARVETINSAIGDGYNVIVMPGYLFGEAVLTVQDDNPDVYFIAIDVGAGDLTFDYVDYGSPAANTVCITFQEDQAGYLAGYAAVADGYTKLGFLGGMAVPAVIRYGYGFVQGCNAAAEELGIDGVEIKYTYGGQFFGDATITAKMDAWYADGTEIVFACGGGIYTSAAEAAMNAGAKVIGVDVDQRPIIDGTFGEGITVTSAMKGLQPSVVSTLTDLFTGNWDIHGGLCENKDLAAGDYVGIPTADASWNFASFTMEQYIAVLEGLKDGSRACSADTENAPEVAIAVDYIG